MAGFVQFSGSQAAFGTTFRGTVGYRNAGKASWRGPLEGFSQLVISWKQTEILFRICFTKNSPKNMKTISFHTRNTILIIRTLNKIFFS
jgi:hypothetical protein